MGGNLNGDMGKDDTRYKVCGFVYGQKNKWEEIASNGYKIKGANARTCKIDRQYRILVLRSKQEK